MIKKISLKLVVLIILILIVNLPVASALQISNTRVTNVLHNSATIQWETDEAADTFVDYGTNRENLHTLGDAVLKNEHQVDLTQLVPKMTYYYKVSSSNQVDDNDGNLYQFTTTEIDIEPPKLKVELPESIAGRSLEITGETEANLKIEVQVNGVKAGETISRDDGSFQIIGILLQENQANQVIVTAADASGNKASVEDTITSDTNAPKIILTDLPKTVTDRSIKVTGTISEESSYEIFLGNQSTAKGEGVEINERVSLQEGRNALKIIAADSSGLETTVEFEILADLAVQFIRAEIERGSEFYEGRAQSSISGETKPRSKVYLYIFRPEGFEYTPDFSKARAVVTADDNGEFRFEDVNFAKSILDIDFEDLAPKEVPEGLQKQKIFSADRISQQTQFTYHVYLISEDQLGRTAFTDQTVNVQTCLSGNFAFGVESIAQFQRPLRLVPQLLDQGRQEIQAVFSFTYTGSGIPGDSTAAAAAISSYGYNNAYGTGYIPGGYGNNYNPNFAYNSAQSAIEVEQGFRISGNPRIEPACTQNLLNDPKFGLGCKLITNTPSITRNSDGTKYYVTWKLHSSKQLSKAEEDFWNEFKKRQVIIPLKITVNYQEREGSNQWSQSKSQTSCYDLGYSVDIPIDSKDLIPDFLANEGVDALNFTISQIEQVRPIVEKIYVITASLAMVSFGLRTVARVYRIATSKIEATFSQAKKLTDIAAGIPEEEIKSCPLDQSKLYLRSTIESWSEYLQADPSNHQNDIPKILAESLILDKYDLKGPNVKKFILEEQCPSTASAWKLEAGTDVAWRWLWDRSFCRAVPAKWTQDKPLSEIGSAIVKQQQCAVTGRGVPLTEVENCQDLVKAQVVNAQVPGTNIVATTVGTQNVGTCWKDVYGTPYIYSRPTDVKEQEAEEYGVFKLTSAIPLLSRGPSPSPSTLLAYKPQGSDQYIIGRGQTCAQVCRNPRRNDQYRADKEKGNEKGCYNEKVDGATITLISPKDNKPLGSTRLSGGEIVGEGNQAINDRYAAGYTSDCFIKGYDHNNPLSIQTVLATDQPVFEQCVCQGASDEKAYYQNADNTLRTAVKREGDVEEAYSYRQDRIFKESKNSAGTYYPEIRYYTGRDVSGAFGANHLFDYFRLASGGQPELHQVNPHNDLVGTFQSVCLSGIHKNLRILENILVGMRNCIVQAKYTGLQDAGMCKTLFTQHVCGLLYKGIAYFTNSCTPLNFDETSKKGEVDALEVVKQGFSAIPEALQTSINDVQDDYGNAKLNEYFREGAQGFAQSMCLAAFGFEFPLLSEDFLLDAAYSFPTASWVVLGPRERELSTFNPAKSTAVFNYNIGGTIMPGCKIRNWKLSLKCIGPEDRGKEGVDETCGGKGCDCLNAQGFGSGSLEVQKEKLLTSGFNLVSGELFSIPLESPQSIDSPYRYDHVKVELYLDPLEKGNEDKCFEQGYFDGQKGVFYEPLVDTSPFVEASCQA
ncbi:MAG TPA: fibronectin type III domain-containing protein, partial [Candidatus Nanoarchaeia archaeon]|nr:fibronectin type III domain-containing protein [Candidatus Nanoarchaeia archaeon]